jgi:hypothetical protein
LAADWEVEAVGWAASGFIDDTSSRSSSSIMISSGF